MYFFSKDRIIKTVIKTVNFEKLNFYKNIADVQKAILILPFFSRRFRKTSMAAEKSPSSSTILRCLNFLTAASKEGISDIRVAFLSSFLAIKRSAMIDRSYICEYEVRKR